LNTQLLELTGRLGKRLEPIIFGFLLLWGWDLDLPSEMSEPIKAASYGILAIFIIPQWQRFLYFSLRDIPLLILVGTAAISIIWSAAPDFTSIEIKALVRSTMFGAYMAMRYSPKEQMRLLFWVVGIAAILSVVFAIAQPSYGTAFINNRVSWKGILTHKQYLGRAMTIGSGVFLLTAIDSKRYRPLALIGLSLFTVPLVLLSQSRTALIILVFTFLMLPIYNIVKQRHYQLRVFLLFSGLMLSAIVAILIVGNLEFIVVDTLGKNLEFNGRLPIWTLIIDKALEQPWLGYGYAGFWTSPEALYVLNNSWAGTENLTGTRFHSHNGFLDVFLQLGVLGLLLFLVHLLTVFIRVWNLFYSTRTVEAFWMLQFITIIFLFNLADAVTILTTGTLWTLYVSVSICSAVEQNRIQKNHQLTANLSNT